MRDDPHSLVLLAAGAARGCAGAPIFGHPPCGTAALLHSSFPSLSLQGKTVIQAEIDAAAELIDFFRFNAKYALELEQSQPLSVDISTNSMVYRGLEVSSAPAPTLGSRWGTACPNVPSPHLSTGVRGCRVPLQLHSHWRQPGGGSSTDGESGGTGKWDRAEGQGDGTRGQGHRAEGQGDGTGKGYRGEGQEDGTRRQDRAGGQGEQDRGTGQDRATGQSRERLGGGSQPSGLAGLGWARRELSLPGTVPQTHLGSAGPLDPVTN